MSFADTFGNGAPTETPYQQLSGAPPVQMGTVKKELRANLRVITDMTAEISRRAKALNSGHGARGETAAESRAQVFAEITSVRETARASMSMLKHACQWAPALHQPELSGLQDEFRTALARFHTAAESASSALGPAPAHVAAGGSGGGGDDETELALGRATCGQVVITMAAGAAGRLDESTAPLMAADIRSPHELQQEQQQQLEAAISLRSEAIAEREAGIAAVQQSVREVHEIFHDLALLVHEQGAQIDNIQTNVESASQRVHRGVGELQTAAKSQRRYRRKLCTLLLLGAIAIVVLIAVLKFALKAAMPF
ncbi:hypothetical protein KFE25_003139 [Diacronema lutheri]|uniref:t-SNARE coiled-coil homology domain-containing protein n=2 Tax=Diacronema lutheri TaxID=2081491 RepID=A0A8J5XAF8_DIALT|nr:hypothetical protein KFE25_003139 [Diacronema lutheri]